MLISPTLTAFLSLIGWSEGADYDTIVTGVDGPATFTDFSDHPFAPQFNRKPVMWRVGPPPEYSTAAGRYQLLYRYWKAYKASLSLPDYSPASQDAVAIQQIKERGGIALIGTGDIEGAIKACSSIWASFPGNDYAQGGRTMADLMDRYQVFTS